MSVWLIIIICLLAILLYLLFAPFFIEIDSKKDLYRARFHRLMSVQLVAYESSLYANFKFVFWNKKIDLLKTKDSKPKKKEIPNSKDGRSKNTFSPSKVMKKAKGLAKSFRIRLCEVVIDTGNYPLNGKLYPWFYFMSYVTGKRFMINFQGENTVILKIKNSIGRILWAYIRS